MKSEPGDETITYTHGIVRPPTSRQDIPFVQRHREAFDVTTQIGRRLGIVRPATSRQCRVKLRHREASNVTTTCDVIDDRSITTGKGIARPPTAQRQPNRGIVRPMTSRRKSLSNVEVS